jgi:O-glycosyl hydrolase
MKKCILALFFLIGIAISQSQQVPEIDGIPAEVDFSKTLQDWDGFGFNYVETAQTMDYENDPQDYGGFSILNEEQKAEIIELVFGEDGLKGGLVKMFLDPWHQATPGAEFDHESSTANMREFVKSGLKKTRERGADFEIITTLYGPPAWATIQKILRGRDLDPDMKEELAMYMVDWAKFLIQDEGLPVKYISLHNEGEDWQRWPRDGSAAFIGEGHDYNLWWPPDQVVDFLKLMPKIIKKAGLDGVYATNGEPSNWYRFNHWGQGWAIYDDKKALDNLGLITSHGFFSGNYWYWFGNHASSVIDKLKEKRPELHTWVTSSSWANMDVDFVRQIFGSIYDVKINGFIPWAGIQRPPLWVGGDPNPGNAIQVNEDSTYEVRNGYYFYKQVTRAGQPGMKVARTFSMDTEAPVLAFSSNGTSNPDAFVVMNTSKGWTNPGFSVHIQKKMDIAIKGTKAKKFRAYRTDGKSEFYRDLGIFEVKGGKISYTATHGSVTTFFAIE